MALPSLRDFTSGVGQGWNTGQQMFDAGVAGLARAAGYQDVARDWERSADEQAIEAQRYANPGTQVAPWREGGGGWGAAAPWLVNTAGQLVGGAAPLVAGGVGGLAAASVLPEALGSAAVAGGLGLASYPQAVGANYQAEREANQAQGQGEVTPEQARSAAAWGVPSAALNAFAPTRAVGLGETAANAVSRTLLDAAKGVAKTGVDNALATAGQKAIEHSFRPDLSDADKTKDMMDSVVTGFLGGAGMGAAGEGVGRLIKAVRPDTPTQDLDAYTKQILEPEKNAVQEQGPESLYVREPAEAGGGVPEGDAFGGEVAAARQEGLGREEGFAQPLQEEVIAKPLAPQQIEPPDVPRQYLKEAETAARNNQLDEKIAILADNPAPAAKQRLSAMQFMKSLLADETGALNIKAYRPDGSVQLGYVTKDAEPGALNKFGSEFWRLRNSMTKAGDFTEETLPINALISTQESVNPDFAKPREMKNDGFDLPAVTKFDGKYYINDGHHRIAKEALESDTAKVRLYDMDKARGIGVEDPNQLSLGLDKQPKTPEIIRKVGNAVARFVQNEDGMVRIPSPDDATQSIDKPAGTPPVDGPLGVAPAVPPLPPKETIPPQPSSILSRASGVLEAAKNSVANLAKDESGALRISKPIPEVAADGTPLKTPADIDGKLKQFLQHVDTGYLGDAARKLGLYVTTNHHHDEMYGHIMPSQLEYSQAVAHRAAISQRMQADAMGNQARINSFAKSNGKLAEHTRNVERAYQLGMDPSKPWEQQPQRVQKGDLYETYKNLHGDFVKSYNALRAAKGGMEMHDVMREQYQTHWTSKPAAVLYTLLNDLADLPDEMRSKIVDPSERLINDPEAARQPSFVSKLMADSLEQNLAVAKQYLDAQEKIVEPSVREKGKREIKKEMRGSIAPSTIDPLAIDRTPEAPNSVLRDLVTDIENQKGMLKDVPYSALVRSGKYGVGFRLATDAEGKISAEALERVRESVRKAGFNNVVIEPLANQDYVFIRSNNKTQVNNLKKLLVDHAKAGDIQEKDFEAGTMDVFSKSPAASKTINNIIKQIESDDRYKAPEGASEELVKSLEMRKKQMISALRDIAVDFLPEASMSKYSEHRNYIPGFEADPLQAMARQSIENAQHVSNLLGTYRVQKALTNMRSAWEEAKNPLSEKNQYEPIMAALYARNMGKEEARGMQLGASPFDALQSLNYSYYLGLNPSFGIIQMSQIPMYVIPELGKRYGFMKSTAAIGKTFVPAMKVLAAVAKEAKKVGGNAVADMPITIDALKNAGLDDETSRFLIHMVNSGGIDTGGLARSLGHISENKTGGFFDNATRWSSAIGYYGETLSRIQTALMAKEVFKGDLKKPEDWNKLINYTHKVLDEALFDYSNENRATGFSDDPRSLLGRSTKLAFAFQAYWMMALEKQYREMHRIFTDANPEAKKEAAKFLLGHAAATALVAGSLGIPGMSAVAALYDKIADLADPKDGPHDMREAYSTWLEHTFGPTVGDAVAYGAPRLIGQDWSKRTGEQDFAPVPTFMYDRANWKDAFNKWALQKEGPAQGAVANVMTAIDKMNAGDYLGAAASVFPAAGVRNVINTSQAMSSGHYRDSRGHTVPNVEVTPGGLASGFIGFTPKNLAREREENAMLHRYDTSIELSSRNLVMPMVEALRNKDMVAFNRMLPAARKFEKDHPGHKIVDRAKETFKREYTELNKAEKTGMPYQRWSDDPNRKKMGSRYSQGLRNQ